MRFCSGRNFAGCRFLARTLGCFGNQIGSLPDRLGCLCDRFGCLCDPQKRCLLGRNPLLARTLGCFGNRIGSLRYRLGSLCGPQKRNLQGRNPQRWCCLSCRRSWRLAGLEGSAGTERGYNAGGGASFIVLSPVSYLCIFSALNFVSAYLNPRAALGIATLRCCLWAGLLAQKED